MPTTRVKRDGHGLYVRTDGNVFRPEATPYTPTRAHPVEGTGWQEGENVKAHHISQTSEARVHSLDRGATGIWHSHGVYVGPGGKTRPSDECWNPAQKQAS